jgi:hypothetical protein
MMKRLREEQLVIHHRHYPEKGYTELTVCAYDAYGMFYRTAGTIAAKNLNILRAQVYTSKAASCLTHSSPIPTEYVRLQAAGSMRGTPRCAHDEAAG